MAMLAWIAIQLINLFIFVLFVSIISSWLIAFGVVNPHNRFVSAVLEVAQKMTDPVLSPIRRLLPNLGGIDISPIFVFIGLQAVKLYILAPIAYQGRLI